MVRKRTRLLGMLTICFLLAIPFSFTRCAKGGGGGSSVPWNGFSTVFDGTGYAQGPFFRTLFGIGIAGHLNAFTVSFWIRFAAFPTAQQTAIMGATTGNSWADGFVVWYGGTAGTSDGTKLRFAPDQFEQNEVGIPEASLTLGAWHHVVGIYDESRIAEVEGGCAGVTCGVRIFLDGNAVEGRQGRDFVVDGTNTDDFREPADGTGRFEIGRAGGTAAGAFQIDEVAIWTDILTSNEIVALYNAGTPFRPTLDNGDYGSSGDLVGYWDMGDGGTYPSLPDRSGNGNDLTLQNLSSSAIQQESPGGSE